MKLGTYHCHTIYCDGKNSIEEMITSALAQKLSHIGFSAHSIFPFASTWHISPKHLDEYFTHIRNVRKQIYDNNIPILIYAGLEADFIPALSKPDFSQYSQFNPDYIIESVHYLNPATNRNKEVFTVDGSPKELLDGCNNFFKGNKKELVKFYFQTEREMIETAKGQIIGHFDLIKKNNKELELFSEEDDWYKKEIEKTITTLAKTNKICEINTGGIARKKIDDIYPSPWILKLMKKQNIPIVLNSDSHSKDTLTTAYDRAIKAAKEAGYSELKILETKNTKLEWISEKIDY